MMQSLHWRRLDQRRTDNKLSLMYKTTHNLSALTRRAVENLLYPPTQSEDTISFAVTSLDKQNIEIDYKEQQLCM